MIASLGPQTRQAVLSQFGSKLSEKKVSDLIRFLDMRFAFMSVTEDAKILEDFERCKRTSNDSLATFLAKWKAALARATLAGYTPSSNISDTLMARAVITDAQTSRVVEDLREIEAQTNTKLKGEARHKAVYESLLKAAAVAEQVKLQRATQQAPLLKANTVLSATDNDKPVKPRKRGRGNKTKTNVNTADTANPHPPKKTKTTPNNSTYE